MLDWKAERGVGVKLCEIEKEAFQEEEAACGGRAGKPGVLRSMQLQRVGHD